MVGGWDWGVAGEKEEADGSETYFGDETSRIGHELSWGEVREIKDDFQVFYFS